MQVAIVTSCALILARVHSRPLQHTRRFVVGLMVSIAHDRDDKMGCSPTGPETMVSHAVPRLILLRALHLGPVGDRGCCDSCHGSGCSYFPMVVAELGQHTVKMVLVRLGQEGVDNT